MAKKKKWTKKAIEAVHLKGLVNPSGRLNDHGWHEVWKQVAIAQAVANALDKPVRLNKVHVGFVVGVSPKTVQRVLDDGPQLAFAPSNRAKAIPPKPLTEAEEARELRRERIWYLKELVEEQEKCRLTKKKRVVSVSQIVVTYPYSNPSELQAGMLEHYGEWYSLSTFRRDLEDLGYRAVYRPMQVGLSDQDKVFRVTMMHEYLKYDPKTFFFVDEKIFSGNARGTMHSWCHEGQDPEPVYQEQNPPTLMFFAGIGHNCRVLVKVPQGQYVNGEFYREHCLPQVAALCTANNLILVQDGAKAHDNAETHQWLANHNVRTMPKMTHISRTGQRNQRSWPPRSPDLNPIENMWGLLSTKVAKRNPFSREDLEAYVREEFDKLSLEYTNKLVKSFKGWAEDCIVSEGNLS